MNAAVAVNAGRPDAARARRVDRRARAGKRRELVRQELDRRAF